MLQHKTTLKLVIFDLDGTLVNSLYDIADSMNRVLAAKGFTTYDYDAYRYFIGRGLRNLVANTLSEDLRSEENITELYAALLVDYKINLLKKTALYKGIPNLLDALKKRGLKLAIFSNKADSLTQKIAQELMSPWKIDVILGSKEDTPRKPDPTGALTICKILEVSPEEVLYVGDTGIDMNTATTAGFYPVGVTWGFRTKEELLESGAKFLIDEPLELLNLLK